MARKDLLKKAFRNNFISKSFADLKSTGAEKVQPKAHHASSANLRSAYNDAAPVLQTPPVNTDAFAAQEQTIPRQEDADNLSGVNSLAPSEATTSSRESVAEWIQTIPKDPIKMTSSEIRREMDEADAKHKVQVLRSYERLLSEHHDLILASEDMVVSHLDTIDTTLALLEVMDALSPHAEALKQQMLEKKQVCADKLIDLSMMRSRLDRDRAKDFA